MPREDDLLKLHRQAGTGLVCSQVHQRPEPELIQCSCSLQLLNHSDEPWAACFSPSAQLPAGFLGFNNQLGRSCYVLASLFTIVTLQKTIPKIISHPRFWFWCTEPSLSYLSLDHSHQQSSCHTMNDLQNKFQNASDLQLHSESPPCRIFIYHSVMIANSLWSTYSLSDIVFIDIQI